jgi:bacterioferritin-associated ferredoxin
MNLPRSPTSADSAAGLLIDRCVCANITFEEIAARSASSGCSLVEFASSLGCGRGCSMCLPYLRRMARTGQTRFHAIISPDDEAPMTPP